MPNIIDSLFLELGIDTSRFSADQKKALAKIAEFEKRSKKSGKGAAQAVKSVGDAFRDIASDTRIGTGAHRLDTLATKLRFLGQSAQVSGGVGTPFGKMAEGLGALLSPATLGIAALGLLGVGVWDLNKKMTATNATISRQAMLSGMNAKNLWAWGEAAKTVGANPQDISGGIVGLQTAVMGMGIGAGNATAQLVALLRLGHVGWNFKTGVNIPELFGRVHQLAAKNGYRNLGALRALTGPLMNDAMWNVATNPTYNPDKLQGNILGKEHGFGTILKRSLESQTLLGKMDIQKAVLAETAYGGMQKPMQTIVGLMTNLLAAVTSMLGWTVKAAGWIEDIWDFIAHPGRDMKNPVAKMISKHVQADLLAHGMKPKAAASTAQAATAAFGQASKNDLKMAGEEMFWPFTFVEKAPAMMAAELLKWLYSKPKAGKSGLVGMQVFGSPSDVAAYMRMLSAAATRPHALHGTVTNETHIGGGIHVHTPATDPRSHAEAVRKGLSTHPLIDPHGQHVVTLSTRGAAG